MTGKCGQEHLYKSIKEDSVLSRTTKVSAGAVCRKNSLFSGAPSVPTTDFVRGKEKESVVFRGGGKEITTRVACFTLMHFQTVTFVLDQIFQ